VGLTAGDVQGAKAQAGHGIGIRTAYGGDHHPTLPDSKGCIFQLQVAQLLCISIGRDCQGGAMGMRQAAKLRRLLVLFFFGLGLNGCSIHPSPEDVTNIRTYYIVRQIRCETRQAVIDSLFRYLASPDNLHDGRLDEHSLAIGRQAKAAYDLDHDSVAKLDPSRLTGFARSVVSLLYHTGVAYHYDLLGLEINNIDPAANFIRPLPITSLVTLGLTGNFDRQRQNERAFTITDNFGDLIKNVRENYCTNHIAEPNYVYPIAGKVGIDQVVSEFLLLTLFGNLSANSKDVPAAAGPPTMVEQLQFQTTIGGGATPKIVFSPGGRTFQASDVSFPISASRRDTHQLTVGLFLDKAGTREIGNVRTAVFRGLITASGGGPEQGAAKAVDQFLAQKIFKPTIVIGP
jgi:hypothetical protein